MDKGWLIVIGYLLVLMSIVRAQSELPVAAGALGVFGISASVTTAVLSWVRQSLRADLEECQTSVADLTGKVNGLLECPADYTQAVDDENQCQTKLQACEKQYFETQENLSKTGSNIRNCQISQDNIKEFLGKLCDAYPIFCTCLEYTNEADCEADANCDWSTKLLCEED